MSSPQSDRSVRRNPSGLPIPQNAATDLPSIKSSGDSGTFGVDQFERRVSRFHPASWTSPALGFGTDHRAIREADQVGPGQDDDGGTPQRSYRLAEQPAWKQAPQPEWLERVQQNQIDVSRQAAVLKTIIKDDELGLELERRDLRQRHPVRVLQMGNIRKVFLEHPPFVVQSFDPSVAAAQDRYAHAAATEPARKPLHHRRLARAPQGQVPDRYDGHGHTVGVLPVPVVGEVAHQHRRPVGDRREP